MAAGKTRLITSLLVALLAALGCVAPVLGATGGRPALRTDATHCASEAATSCCGGDCRCGDACPCAASDPSNESQRVPLAPSDETRSARGICLSAPPGACRAPATAAATGRCAPPVGDDLPWLPPAGRELLERVSKWTT
jgi:hypothetical protein